jgi:hypothetical protein
MPRTVAAHRRYLEAEIDRAISLARAGELIRASATSASLAYRELFPARLEALYEMSYLRVFVAWEKFLEETFLRYICGYRNSHGAQVLLRPRFSKLDDARTDVLGGADFASWQKANKIIARSKKYISSGLHETVIGSVSATYDWYSAVRNRVAHASNFSKTSFDAATMGLAGRRYRGSSAGRFLRDWVPALNPQERWLFYIGGELKTLSKQIAP